MHLNGAFCLHKIIGLTFIIRHLKKHNAQATEVNLNACCCWAPVAMLLGIKKIVGNY
jgi:hypothetical protein